MRRRWCGYFGTERASGMDWLSSIDCGEVDGCLLVAEADDQRIGCGIGYATDAEYIAEDAVGVDGLPSHGTAGYLPFSCVAPGYRKQGIHSAMVRERVRSLLTYGVDRMHTISWVREGHHDSVGQFGGTWNIVDYLTDYYQTGRGYCPDCGETCECHPVIWQLDAEQAEVEYGF